MDEASVALLDSEEEVRVGAASNVQKLATVISSIVKDGRTPVVRAVGVPAVNQAMKAIITARGRCATHGLDLLVVPGMDAADGLDADGLTCMVLRVVRREYKQWEFDN